MRHERLFMAMTEYDAGDPHRIQHFAKVYAFARQIALAEGLGGTARDGLEAAAIVHDIGIKAALEKHGASDGKLQELEGPPLARSMLEGLGYPPELTERVCYLVGRHHTYRDIDGLDYRILLEADFLVNLHESGATEDAVRSALRKIFRTETGARLCRAMFGIA